MYVIIKVKVKVKDKVEVEVLGVVENMSYYLCPNCDKRHEIFGRGGGKAAADRQQVPFWGEVPLIEAIRSAGDHGQPAALHSQYESLFTPLCTSLVEGLRALEPND